MAHYKEFEFDCDFGGQRAKFKFYIGTAQEGHHPLQFQAKWLSDERSGTIPDEVMKEISQLNDLAKKTVFHFRIYAYMLLVLLKKPKLPLNKKMKTRVRTKKIKHSRHS